MMSLACMRDLARKAGKEAKHDNRQPYFHPYKGARGVIPFLGDYVPKYWERTEREPLFVDTSGFGRPGEPALTTDQMFDAFEVGKAYGLIEVGQFQGYVAEFQQTGRGWQKKAVP